MTGTIYSPARSARLCRRTAAASFVAALALATLSVFWAGLSWPPPLWLVEYGLPWSQRPTGRVARIEGIEFVEISPGYFRMGSHWRLDRGDTLLSAGDVVGRFGVAAGLPWGRMPFPSEEMPLHWVELPHGFFIARTEVTNSRYDRFDPKHGRPSFYGGRATSPGDGDPVMGVTWDEAKAFCDWLAQQSKVPVRLPSESEWECACRAGGRGEYDLGGDEARLAEYAWYAGNSDGRAHSVGTKRANAWGLHDLRGNAPEWCADTWWYEYEFWRKIETPNAGERWEKVEAAPADGSPWLAGKSDTRVARGGSWELPAECCRPGYRDNDLHWMRYRPHGFRPAFALTPRQEPLVEPYLVDGR